MKTTTSPKKLEGILLLIVAFASLLLSGCVPPPPPPPPPPASPTLPDLVLVDIVLKPKPAGYGSQDDVIINTVVQNNGADAVQGFLVWCSFQCKDPTTNSPTYFSGMELPNGLASGQQATLGDDVLLSLSDCPFSGSRTFSCVVDQEDYVKESDETNNTLSELLLTGR